MKILILFKRIRETSILTHPTQAYFDKEQPNETGTQHRSFLNMGMAQTYPKPIKSPTPHPLKNINFTCQAFKILIRWWWWWWWWVGGGAITSISQLISFVPLRFILHLPHKRGGGLNYISIFYMQIYEKTAPPDAKCLRKKHSSITLITIQLQSLIDYMATKNNAHNGSCRRCGEK